MMQMTIEEHIKRLLKPQPTLDFRLFNYNQIMNPKVREKLLQRAKFVIDMTGINRIEGIEINDICLCGSSATYFYRENSDIDLKIMVCHKNCPFITNTQEIFDDIINAQSGRLFLKGYRYFLGSRAIDIKMSSYEFDRLGLYSIKNNCWIKKPSPDACAEISPQELLTAYQKRKEKIEQSVKEIKENFTGIALGDALNAFFIHEVLENPDLIDFLVYKLLNYNHVLKDIGAESIRAYNRALSS